MQQKKYRDEYREFLDTYARTLVLEAQKPRVPGLEVMPPIGEIRNAFEINEGSSPAPGDGGAPNLGPGAAQFLFIAGTDAELREVRERVEAYGPEGGRDWRPFHPDIPRPVGVISQGVAADAELYYEQLPLGDDLLARLRAAEQTNTIVLILVDPWSAELNRYRERLTAFDQANFINCGILVTWNVGDEETASSAQRLRDQIRQSLYRTFVSGGTFVRDSVESAEQLEREVREAIDNIRRKINQHAEVMRPVDSGQLTSLPQVSGPGRAAS